MRRRDAKLVLTGPDARHNVEAVTCTARGGNHAPPCVDKLHHGIADPARGAVLYEINRAIDLSGQNNRHVDLHRLARTRKYAHPWDRRLKLRALEPTIAAASFSSWPFLFAAELSVSIIPYPLLVDAVPEIISFLRIAFYASPDLRPEVRMSLSRLLQQIPSAESLFSGSAHAAGVERILHAVRSHLRMDVAFASEVTATETVIRFCDADGQAPFQAGAAFPVDEGYCKRILEGRLPPLIFDAATVPEVANLACTREMKIGAHISVPLILSDGSIFGTFCCFSFHPDYTLSARDVDMMRAFADLAAAQIEAEVTLSARQASVVEQISKVIERDNLTMVYQPIYSLDTDEVVGVEALARFPDQERRSPAKWFAEAAELGLGHSLELAACRAALRSLSRLPEDVYLAVNVSPGLVLRDQLAKLLEDVPPGRLVLEVTEHAIIKDFALFQQSLAPLRSHVRIAVDDAGAGYSGLRHILDVRPDIIKLDMSLTRSIDSDSARHALATAMIAFAREIGSQIVAEGVETAGELDALHRLGIHCAQGYFLQRPMPLAAISQLLNSRRVADSPAESGAVGRRRNSSAG